MIYQRKLAALDELKKSLLHQAFTSFNNRKFRHPPLGASHFLFFWLLPSARHTFSSSGSLPSAGRAGEGGRPANQSSFPNDPSNSLLTPP
jgi:hypothetical protein